MNYGNFMGLSTALQAGSPRLRGATHAFVLTGWQKMNFKNNLAIHEPQN